MKTTNLLIPALVSMLLAACGGGAAGCGAGGVGAGGSVSGVGASGSIGTCGSSNSGGSGGGSSNTGGTDGTGNGGTGTNPPVTQTPTTDTGPDTGPDADGRVTSTMLLHQALTNGAITQEQSILYNVYAQFGDSRLPPQYQGDDSATLEANSLADAAEYFASVGIDHVSTETADAIRPYFIPPYYATSAFQTKVAANANGAGTSGATIHASSRPADTTSNPTKTGWTSVPGTHVVVWYRNGNAGTDASTAATLQSEYDSTIWPKLTALMGRTPKSDQGTDGLLGTGVGFTEDDGRLDVFLDDLSKGEGVTIPITPTFGGRTKDVPARIFLSRALPMRGLLAQAAHEFMHAIQYSYNMAGPGLNDYMTLKESTATWASHYVYANNWETKYAKYYLTRQNHTQSLDSRPDQAEFYYGAYVFPLYLETQYTADIVKTLWETTLTQTDDLSTIDTALVKVGSSFREQWPKFIAAAWNQETLNKLAPFGVTDKPDTETSTPASLQGGGYTYIANTIDLPHASMVYHRIDFPNADVRSLMFMNGINYSLDIVNEGPGDAFYFTGLGSDRRRGVSMQIFLKVNGVWQTQPTVFTNTPWFTVCRDDPSGKIESVILMYGNAETISSEPNYQHLISPNLAGGLYATNIGCKDWQGSLSFTHALEGGRNGTETMTISNVTMKNVMPVAAPAAGDPGVPYVLAENQRTPAGFGFVYAPTAGSATWTYHGTTPGPADACQYDGTKSLSIVGAGNPLFTFSNWSPPGVAFHGGVFAPLLSNVISDLVGTNIDWSCVDSEGHRTTGQEPASNFLDLFLDFTSSVKVDATGLSISGTGAQATSPNVTGTWKFTGKTTN